MIMCIHIFKVFPNEIKGNVPRGISPVPKVEHSIFKVKSRGHFYRKSLYSPSLRGVYEIKSFSSKPGFVFLQDSCIKRGYIETMTSQDRKNRNRDKT